LGVERGFQAPPTRSLKTPRYTKRSESRCRSNDSDAPTGRRRSFGQGSTRATVCSSVRDCRAACSDGYSISPSSTCVNETRDPPVVLDVLHALCGAHSRYLRPLVAFTSRSRARSNDRAAAGTTTCRVPSAISRAATPDPYARASASVSGCSVPPDRSIPANKP
jgi:hypothetical protein